MTGMSLGSVEQQHERIKPLACEQTRVQCVVAGEIEILCR